MSRENIAIISQPLRALDRPRRTLDQRLLLRFPRMTAAYVRLVGRLPPASKLRQAAIRRGVGLGIEAYNRRDLAAAVVGWDADFDYRPGLDWVKDGLVESSYRGLEGYRRYARIADEVAGGALYLKPIELIDLGDRLVILADAPTRGHASGSPADPFAVIATLHDGRVVLAQEYFDHAAALEAAGLRQ
jgi:hypothetical protein